MSGTSGKTLPLGAATYLIHHVFLPPKLPQKDDFDLGHEIALLDVTVASLSAFKDCIPIDRRAIVSSAIAMISSLKAVHLSGTFSGGAISEDKLKGALSDLCKNGGTIPLHLRAQNCGLMISKSKGSIHVEAFELSPFNKAVISTKGRLRRTFPGCAISIDPAIFEQPSFIATTAQTLAKMSHQSAVETKSKAWKASRNHDEDRDTIHPNIVTELFMGFLKSVGQPVDVYCIAKHTREEVMYKATQLPWRRSPLWLLVRVTLQLLFSRSTTGSESGSSKPCLYKTFMVFFLSHILKSTPQQHLNPDIMYAMNAKIIRRLSKLGSSMDEPVLQLVQDTVRIAHDLLQKRWEKVMAKEGPLYSLTNLTRLDFDSDVFSSLPTLDGYIQSIADRRNHTDSCAFEPKAALIKNRVDQLPTCLNLQTNECKEYNLMAFEGWVASNLSLWLKSHMDDPSTCGRIGGLIQKYHGLASSLYSGDAEATSKMILTIVDLWVACDESATRICELLKDYNPGIPSGIFESLVLPLKSQMQRLLRTEQYLDRRRGRASPAARCIFREFGSEESFAAKFFNLSPEHQTLYQEIELQAHADRAKKREELRQLKGQYKKLYELHAKSECEFSEVVVDSVNNFREQRHRDNGCKKCQYAREADSLKIRVHEWPLPTKEWEAKATVFELKVSSWFGHWRDTTVFLIQDVLGSEQESILSLHSSHPLRIYPGLSSFFTPFGPTQRIGLLSESKPHEVTHRRNKPISTTEENDICLVNGLRYQYFDDQNRRFVTDYRATDKIPKSCTFKLPKSSAFLQPFLIRPATNPNGPSPNTVIARQIECPDHISLDEFKYLAAIPLGHRLQWLNVLLQLSMPTIDFKKAETGLVILQSIYQAGPRHAGNFVRAGHVCVAEEHFASRFLGVLHEALDRVRENWESCQAVNTFISLASRLLSLSSDQQIKTKSLLYLADARVVAFEWVHLLREKAEQATNDTQRIELSSRAVESALICANSFNVDENHLEDILSNSESASVFLQCSMIIQEGRLAMSKTTDFIISILQSRWKRLAYRCYPIFSRQVLRKETRFLEDAIKKSWPAYQAGYGWQAVSTEVDHWLVSQATPQTNDDSDALWIHINLLTYELLVNGLPLTRLPPEYERHATYRTLFGESAIEVMPTMLDGMRFSGKKEFAGYTLHFGMNTVFEPPNYFAENDFLVQAIKGNLRYELIPARLFRGQFPQAFVEGFVHWYNHQDKSLEFRPIGEPWTSLNSSQNTCWRLTKSNLSSKWVLQKDGMSLAGFKSETARLLSDILSPLENPLRIHVMLRHDSSTLEIELPRLQLVFNYIANTSSIESKQFRGMSIDPNQTIGTLVGLHNKLILKDRKQEHRLLILPEGSVTFQIDADHVRVNISKDSSTKAHAYHVDDHLGRLIDNGSLHSKLYLCYLHALTSFCLPDPLLNRTGTEQALSILTSAGIRSFDQLRTETVEILTQIAQLTPQRSYYPPYERCMQTVDWSSNLGFLAQHGSFYKHVKSIFVQAERSNTFHPDFVLPRLEQELDLLERDCIRSSFLRVSDFGAEEHTVNNDTVYSARDRDHHSARGLQAFVIASIVYQKRPNPHYPVVGNLKDYLMDYLSTTDKIHGPNKPAPCSKLCYDSDFLLESSTFVSTHWSSLHLLFSKNTRLENRFQLMIWLATLAFAPNMDMQVIQTLASFYTVSAMAQNLVPPLDFFELRKGADFKRSALENCLVKAYRPFSQTPAAKISARSKETFYACQERQKTALQAGQKDAIKSFVDNLQGQWPCEVPSTPSQGLTSLSGYLDVAKAMAIAKLLLKPWFDNFRFLQYLSRIQGTFMVQQAKPFEKLSYTLTSPAKKLRNAQSFISTDDILACSAPLMPPLSSADMSGLLTLIPGTTEMSSLLSVLMADLSTRARSQFEDVYAKDLQGSISSLKDKAGDYVLQVNDIELELLLNGHLKSCREHVDGTYALIMSALTSHFEGEEFSKPKNGSSAISARVMHWPRLSPIFFLQQLSRGRWSKISEDWKRSIIAYGLALSKYQQAERILSVSGNKIELVKELQNSGHGNWDPYEFPESLLLEIESGITIRDVQEEIARQMRDPALANNAVMQLNMGEGKSSVIVPIVAACLANGARLVRVIVAKPQSKQMFEMLLSKFGGLLGRRIYHMPFSRAVKLTKAQAATIELIYNECMANGGILLVQPEHILSFKLMCIECIIMDKAEVGDALLRTQHFFDRSSRDIVDESDENFSVKFELIYTMGMQRPIEFSPERWTCIQHVLDLFKLFAPSVKKLCPISIDVHEARPGSFPRTRLLRTDAQNRILREIAEHICQTGLDGFPIARQPEPIRQAVLRYITELDLTPEEIAQVEDQGPGGFWADATCSTLLLLRGLLAEGVLAFAFSQKRWKVNYGLDPSRRPSTKLAVPYRAKDSPTPRSEFSHPDVVIVLTSLSYYYGGLTDDDLFLTFGHLSKSDQAEIEYQLWAKDSPSLDHSFRTLAGINLKDRVQCISKVFPPLRYAKGAVDYFLAHIVFPKEMKEFPHKLSSSGWDIGAIKTHPTTGFSGTNDSRKVLPLTVEHLDLSEQKHTNALVLDYLLRPENHIALVPERDNSSGSDADILLAMVTKAEMQIQVIIDVGAQILELSNLGVAIEWLRIMSNKNQSFQGAVFFNDNDELSVIDRKGNVEALQTSSFAKHLDVCLVFLDEAHTRGTDLRLPDNYRAAVTLGPNLTKDRLVQACMRMRKLGKGQSVVFFVPEEIKSKILEQKCGFDDATISVSDVLSWAMSETYIDIRRSMPLWAAQGQRFQEQSELWEEACDSDGFNMAKAHAQKFLEEESQSLEHRYRPVAAQDVSSFIREGKSKYADMIAERCREFNDLKFDAATLQEEQERELAPEIEQERQVQRPASANPASHEVHPDMIRFVAEGIPIADSKAYIPAFEILRNTSAAAHLDVSQFPRDLLVTTDFGRTVEVSGPSYISDAYLRPVQWILTSIRDESCNNVIYMMIISPHEAQELLPKISSSKKVALHLYSPRSNLGLRAIDGLQMYTIPAQPTDRIIPRRLTVQLNLFAGQLYLDSFEEYVEVCEMLGIAWQATEAGYVVAADGFIVQGGSGASKSTFKDSPVKFLRVLLTRIRRNCEGVDKTHMGKILDGRLLRASDFDGESDGK